MGMRAGRIQARLAVKQVTRGTMVTVAAAKRPRPMVTMQSMGRQGAKWRLADPSDVIKERKMKTGRAEIGRIC